MGDDDRVAAILCEWCARSDEGENVDPESVIRAHPELAAELREGFRALDVADLAFHRADDGEMSVPESIGPYRILRLLGRGGMGTVYLAESTRRTDHIEANQRVALKVVHPHLMARPGFFKRFLREGELGKRVVHENVVRTLDVDAGQAGVRTLHYLVMEYVAGRTLRDLLTDLGAVSEALLREIARQIAEGLSAIHAEGIVHRDLKPENVLITDDERVRIMDLGVARLEGAATALTQEGQFAGSLLYAAPEQIRRAEVGPAGDLYALGVLLYELATGENPFHYDDVGAVMHAHLETVPARAQDRVPDLSLFLSEALGTLLEKEPENRFSSATCLRDALEAGERSPWWREREGALLQAQARVPRVPVRRETELHGREGDLAFLCNAWQEARSGNGRIVLLEGEAGIGKSRLIDAFLQEAAGEDAHVLYGSYPPSGGMGGLSDAVLDRLGAGDLADSLRPYLQAAPALVPGLSAVLRHDVPDADGPSFQGDVLHAAFCHLMRGIAAEKPLVWIVEDLHFAEGESLRIVLSLARALERQPVLLLLTTRPGLPEAEVTHFARLDSFRRRDLARLGARDVVLLLEEAFRSKALAEKLAGKIAFKSDGIPFFVFEMIRGLKEGQFITELPDGSYVESKVIEDIEVPSAVKDLIEVRLKDLDDGERAILDVGAVLGYEFDPRLVALVLEERRISVLQRLAAIERRSGVVRVHGRLFRLDHHQIQEVLYEALPVGLREEYHAAIAEALEHGDLPGVSESLDLGGTRAVEVCDHYLKGGRSESARPHLDGALSHLGRGYRNERAVRLAERALVVPGFLSGGERATLLCGLSTLLMDLSRHEPARTAAEEALAIARQVGDRLAEARALRLLGHHYSDLVQHAEARRHAEQSLAIARELKDLRNEAQARMLLGRVSFALSSFDDALEHYERALFLSREVGDQWGEAAALHRLGGVHLGKGRLAEAQEHYERALALAQEVGARLTEALAAQDLCSVLTRLGRTLPAREHAERALSISREIGNRHAEAGAAKELGWIAMVGHANAAAVEHFERCMTISREIGNRQGEAVALANLGSLFKGTGCLADAREHFERGVAIAREIGNRGSVAAGLVNLGPLRAMLGDLEGAHRDFVAALTLCREIGARDPEGYALQGLGDLAAQRGDEDGAERLMTEALDLRRAIGHRAGESITLLCRGAMRLQAGRHDKGRTDLEVAIGISREMGQGGVMLLAFAYLARLPGGDPGPALDELAEDPDVAVERQMRARFILWEATRDPLHLEEARRHLDHLVAHAPEDCRDTMIENVPLHRDITEAWAAYQVSRRGDD